jgi:hypothetical protein
VTQPFHQVTIAANNPASVIDDFAAKASSKMSFCNRHPYGVR